MKKIVIFIVTVLVLGVISMYSCIANSKRIEQEKTKNVTEATENIQEVIEENNNNSNLVNNINNESNESVQNEQKQDTQIKENKGSTTSKTIRKSNIESTKQEKSTIQKTQETNNSKKENKVVKTESSSNESKKEENKKVEITNEEKRVRNDKMIETMKNVIKNNETEDMKNFGYEIVVDSSIKSKTNYFTYTEKRLISKILYRFGTIRIYAEDLYVNGGYAHTECFIY